MIHAAFAAVLAISSLAAATSEPFRAIDRIAGVSATGEKLAAVVYERAEGIGGKIEASVVIAGRPVTGFTQTAPGGRVEFLDGHDEREFFDLFHDKSRVFAYRTSEPALALSTLHLVRYTRYSFRTMAEFSAGRFLHEGNKLLIVAKDLPLGRFLSVGCGQFGAISQSAYRTRLYAPRRGKFIDVSAEHPTYYEGEINRKESALDRLRSDLARNAGEYLGLALSAYFDYAATGRARQGWEKQAEYFRLPSGTPPAARTCFASIRADLRKRLDAPPDWP